ncbi:MAG TPA: peptidoglycan DD-metalloendopeptidase family protein [Casimicrobiaceae bacterium]|nr:peptidoglycan DD-metalloendopeptidase family protein [Casimicrobiaceae bacterium]
MSNRARVFVAASFAALLLLAACASKSPAPVVERSPVPTAPAAALPPPSAPEPPRSEWRPQTYTVKAGDTLAKIALDYGLDYRELASWNGIDNPNIIRVGQVLMLAAPGQGGAAPAPGGGAVTAPLTTTAPVAPGGTEPKSTATAPAASPRSNTVLVKSEPKLIKLPYSEQALAQLQATAVAPPVAVAPPPPAATSPPPAVTAPPVAAAAPSLPPRTDAHVPEIDDDKIEWVWPTSGKIVAGFSESASLKGIDIAGKAGQPVVASAAGKVVYAGAGLRGYGKLVIIKHNNTYLTAYAHNREILVKEKQEVAKGQKISEMGDTDADQVKLHFEIRRLGKPVDPTKYLPPA